MKIIKFNSPFFKYALNCTRAELKAFKAYADLSNQDLVWGEFLSRNNFILPMPFPLNTREIKIAEEFIKLMKDP